MSTSHVSAAAWGFLAAPLLSIFGLILFGEGGMTASIRLNVSLVTAGALVAGIAQMSRNRPAHRARRRGTFIALQVLSDHMRRDIGLDPL
jgi:hypothetical protein